MNKKKYIKLLYDSFDNGFIDNVGAYCPEKVVWIKDKEGIKVFVYDE